MTLAGRVDSLAPASGLEFSLLPPDNATGNFTKVVQRVPVKIAIDEGTAGIEKESAGSASSLFNMTRNLGGAVGIAMLQTLLTKREQFHSNVLVQSVSLFAEATRRRIAHMTAYFLSHGLADKATATHKAIAAIGLRVRQQATVMAFSDTFYLIGLSLIVALLASLLLTKPKRLSAGGAH